MGEGIEMPRASAARLKYRVLNPRNIPADVPILTLEEKSKGGVVLQALTLYEGQTFAPPGSVNVDHLLASGFIERA